MTFRLPLQFTQISLAPGLSHSRPRSRNNPVKNTSHKESFDYKGLTVFLRSGAPFLARLLRQKWGFWPDVSPKSSGKHAPGLRVHSPTSCFACHVPRPHPPLLTPAKSASTPMALSVHFPERR